MNLNLTQNLIEALSYSLLCIALPAMAVIGVSWLAKQTDIFIDDNFGAKAEIYYGAIGIMIHELSHLIIALIFGHRIEEAKILILPWNVNMEDEHPKLGYVNHSWDKQNLYQEIGNVFIGTAPIYGCLVALYGLYRFLTPSVYASASKLYFFLSQGYDLNFQIISASLEPLKNITLLETITALFALILSINITIGGFSLSGADMKSALNSLFPLFCTVFLAVLVLLCIGLRGALITAISHFLFFIAFFVLIAIISLLVVYFFAMLIKLIA